LHAWDSFSRLATYAVTRGDRTPVVSIIIVVYAGGWDWPQCALDALRAMTPKKYEVIVLDNGPPERVPSIFRRDIASATVIKNRENVGFGPAAGVLRPEGEHLVPTERSRRLQHHPMKRH